MNATVMPPICPDTVLNQSPLTHLRRLVVTVSEGEVIITGRVPSYYLKQLAQETIRPTLGDRRLRNQVEVGAC
jgi:osmotically-inducible protein OsmY